MLGRMMAMPLTIHSVIAHGARYHGDTEILSIETDGIKSRTSWRLVSDRAPRLSSALAKLGLARGDSAATIAWNNSQHFEFCFGLSCDGFTCHTVNPRLFPEQLAYIVNCAGNTIVFVDKTFLQTVAALKDKLTVVNTFVMLSAPDPEVAQNSPGLHFYGDFLATDQSDADWVEMDEFEASSLCSASGASGKPKDGLYSHRTTELRSLSAALPASACPRTARPRITCVFGGVGW